MEQNEQPKQYTPEEIAEMEKSRTISDAELLKGGAEYVVNEDGEKENLIPAGNYRYHIEELGMLSERENESRIENLITKIEDYYYKLGVVPNGSKAYVYFTSERGYLENEPVSVRGLRVVRKGGNMFLRAYDVQDEHEKFYPLGRVEDIR